METSPKRSLTQTMLAEVHGDMGEITFGRKYAIIFGGTLALAGIVIATVVFPFWNLIRADMYEDVVILSNDDGVCAVDTSDRIPKQIDECSASVGETVTVRYGEGLAWAHIVP